LLSSPTPSDPSSAAFRSEPPAERRGWLVHGLMALAISAFGLAVAGAVAPPPSSAAPSAVVSSASRPVPLTVPGTSTVVQAQVDQSGVPSVGRNLPGTDQPGASSVVAHGSLAAFAKTGTPPDPTDAAVQRAVVKERAAQRAEDLSKEAEDAARVTRTTAKNIRHQKLADTDREIRQAAIQIAAERRQRALALRIAAEVARRRAELNAAAAQTPAPLPGVPTTGVPTTGTPTVPAAGQGVSPVPGAVVGTPFGATGIWARYHTGLDFRAAQGTPIRAVQSGVVLYAGNSGNWAGNHVAIMHAGGITTMSSHMSSMAVHAGEQVTAGQVIGRVGQTGRAFGPHLHFEVYPNGVKYGDIYHAVNPVPWLLSNGVHTQ
jgi:murein DD-endopeptidase MepM/ murein hydrolase activator NlpD